MSNSKSRKKIEEILIFVECPKCGTRYLASNGHCPNCGHRKEK